MRFRLKEQHFDMLADSEWFDVGPVMPLPGTGESRLVTEIEGDTSEGCFRVVPLDKLEIVHALDTKRST
jgi:hypothetical protein